MIADFLSVLRLGTSRETERGAEKNTSIKTNFYEDSLSEGATEIVLQRFIEIELDLAGWFALGHYRPKEFIKAVAKYENHRDLTEKRIKQAWAKVEGQRIEYFEEPVAGAQPITLAILCD